MKQLAAQVDKLKRIIALGAEIATGDKPDTINLAELSNKAEDIADTCFAGGSMSPAQMIARKDAYDFVVATSRLAEITSLTRPRYYEEATRGAKTVSERVDYVQAVATILNSAGN